MGGTTLSSELLILLSESSTEIISVAGTILCVVLFYFYLQRLDIQLIGDVSHQDDHSPIPETKVMTSTLPFSVKFIEESSSPASFKDGVLIEVHTSFSCFLHVFWVVDCTSFSEMLRSQDCQSVRPRGLNLAGKLEGISHSNSEKYFLDADTLKSIQLKFRDDFNQSIAGSESESDFNLGPTPRSKYPLVILMSLHDENYETWSHSVSIDTMLWIVHLPDTVVTKPLHIISQMLITSQGLVCDVQKMYMAADETSFLNERPSVDEEPSLGDNNHSIPFSEHASLSDSTSRDSFGDDVSRNCIVCQNASITRVIIPCRHACVCQMCLEILNACPMCRGVISSHFRLDGTGNTDNDGDERSSDLDDRGNDWKTRLWNMNERLNELFGFR
ncbi:cell growth regulator with RING finger domain protein 1-like [Lytechinus variegatus]|uniref:cell growth regulator with RING finger domain protein 1-like n=1 Tax=Lytechinus variegatus TaxID=7654 RepID=UPI001BB1BF80|nr:cell growth regulator with RING finger domain protein 1-like [Lytechinus variegatus]